MQIRVGLNSGEVVVRSIGSDLHMDYTAVGQTTHLAARMEQLADPGTHAADRRHAASGGGLTSRSSPGSGAGQGHCAEPVEVFELTGAARHVRVCRRPPRAG